MVVFANIEQRRYPKMLSIRLVVDNLKLGRLMMQENQ